MNREQIIQMAREAGWKDLRDFDSEMRDEIYMGNLQDLERFAALVAASEREAIAKMFDEPMSLVPFAQNHLGGCMICGFTPKMAANSIRARGQE